MAVPKKLKKDRIAAQFDANLDDFSEGVLTSIREDTEALYRQHANRIRRLVDDSESSTATITFSVLIDKSESAPKVRTRIRFGETTTDERIRSLEDPNQPTLFTPEQLEKNKKAGKTTGAPPRG
jgi:hypothetical protein